MQVIFNISWTDINVTYILRVLIVVVYTAIVAGIFFTSKRNKYIIIRDFAIQLTFEVQNFKF